MESIEIPEERKQEIFKMYLDITINNLKKARKETYCNLSTKEFWLNGYSFLTETRRIDIEEIKRFKLGLAKGIKDLEQLYNKGINIEEMVNANLCFVDKFGAVKPRFVDRIIIPTQNEKNEIQYFVGRAVIPRNFSEEEMEKIFQNKSTAKYNYLFYKKNNSSENENFKKYIYQKGSKVGDNFLGDLEELVNTQGVNENGNKVPIFLLEGSMDYFRMKRIQREIGFEGLFFSIGSASLSNKQAEIILNNTTKDNKIFIFTDSDVAGTSAKINMAKKLLENNRDVKVIVPKSDKKDADEIFFDFEILEPKDKEFGTLEYEKEIFDLNIDRVKEIMPFEEPSKLVYELYKNKINKEFGNFNTLNKEIEINNFLKEIVPFVKFSNEETKKEILTFYSEELDMEIEILQEYFSEKIPKEELMLDFNNYKKNNEDNKIDFKFKKEYLINYENLNKENQNGFNEINKIKNLETLLLKTCIQEAIITKEFDKDCFSFFLHKTPKIFLKKMQDNLKEGFSIKNKMTDKEKAFYESCKKENISDIGLIKERKEEYKKEISKLAGRNGDSRF